MVAPSQPLAEHMKFKYILSADGYSTAWRRVPFVLFSNSLLFKTMSSNVQWFYDKIIPGEHFVSIKDDLSDMFTQMEEMNKNDAKAK